MSYSFNAQAATKAAALAAVAAKFDETVKASQPIHERDRAAVLANAEAVINLLGDDDTKDVTVSCNGYLSWDGRGTFHQDVAPLTSAAVSCAAGYVARPAPAADSPA